MGEENSRQLGRRADSALPSGCFDHVELTSILFVLVYLFGLDTCLLYFICALLLDGEIYTVSTVVDEEEILFKEKVASVWTSRTGVITCTYVITWITSGGRI